MTKGILQKRQSFWTFQRILSVHDSEQRKWAWQLDPKLRPHCSNCMQEEERANVSSIPYTASLGSLFVLDRKMLDKRKKGAWVHLVFTIPNCGCCVTTVSSSCLQRWAVPGTVRQISPFLPGPLIIMFCHSWWTHISWHILPGQCYSI